MASERVRVLSITQNELSLAFYFHCDTHRLNLSASATITVTGIRNAESTVKEVVKMFKTIFKKLSYSKLPLKMMRVKKKKRFLTSLCETRFVERHTSIVTFQPLLKYVLHCLSQIKSWSFRDASKQAWLLESTICTSDFIVGLFIWGIYEL